MRSSPYDAPGDWQTALEVVFFGADMASSQRFALLDLLRVLAAQLIVWHHLAFYGPLSDHAYAVAPGPIDWLYEYGRFAVQVFFVAGGYCMALALARRPPAGARAFLRLVVERYFRLGLPYLAALAVALIANEIARSLMTHASISPRPTAVQLLAHLFLVHQIIGYESVTAGIWYVAIDLQLVAIVGLVYAACLRLLPARGASLARWALLGLGLLSVFFWNRVPDLDRFGIYFLGSYVLGMAAAWATDGSLPKGAFAAYLVAVAVALQIDFRMRLVVAAVTAVVLLLAQGSWQTKLSGPLLRRFSQVTYSLFLIHFPICLVLNAWWSTQFPPDPWLSLAGMAVAWVLSVAGGFAFYHAVEKRLAGVRLPGPLKQWLGTAPAA